MARDTTKDEEEDEDDR